MPTTLIIIISVNVIPVTVLSFITAVLAYLAARMRHLSAQAERAEKVERDKKRRRWPWDRF